MTIPTSNCDTTITATLPLLRHYHYCDTTITATLPLSFYDISIVILRHNHYCDTTIVILRHFHYCDITTVKTFRGYLIPSSVYVEENWGAFVDGKHGNCSTDTYNGKLQGNGRAKFPCKMYTYVWINIF